MPNKVPTYYGSPSTCAYCIEGVYPHTHGELPEAPDGLEQPRSTVKRQRKEKVTATSAEPRRRGRPMKPENIELLKVCEGH